MDVGIRDLKARLSEHLERVARGEVITVTSRGRRVAQIVPVLGRDRLDRGLAEGWVTRQVERPPEPILDTSVIYALLDAADRRHRQALEWYDALDEELVTTPLVLAEADHLAATRGGPRAVRAFRADVGAGAYLVEWWPTAAREAAELADRYADLGIGLTDASLVALAARVGSADVATFDERHFRAVRPLGAADAFRLLPLDASG